MSEHETFQDPELPPGEPVEGQTYRADGWAYVRMNIPITDFNNLFNDLGSDMVVLTAAFDMKTVSCVLLISPSGQAKIDAVLAQVENPN